MDIRIRRLVSIIFFVIFITVAPLLLLYSMGYKYNWQKHKLEKTGVFFIKSYPKNSDIYINGKKYRKDTPTQITRLLPKVYNVELRKEDYFSWHKNLTIYPQLTTFVEDVSLIYKEPKFETLMLGNFTNFLISSNNQQIALIEENNNSQIIWIYNTINDNFTELYKTSKINKLDIISWSFSNKKILINQNNSYLILNTTIPGVTHSLTKITNRSLNNVKWDKYNDNILYALNNNRLLQINVIKNSFKQINDDLVLNYHPYKTKIVAITKNSNKYYLKIFSNKKEEILFSLPYSDSYEFEKIKNDYLILFDKQQNQLYLLNPEDANQPVKSFLKNVVDFRWHDNQLIYWSNSELWAYYVENDQRILLERTSQQIQNAFWHPNTVYAYAVINNVLKLYEIDSRDQRNIYEILGVDTNEENFIATNKKGDYLYLITTGKDGQGLYKVEIQ